MNLKTYKILVVDDDPGVRDSYRKILSRRPALDFIAKGADLFDEKGKDSGTASDRQYEVTFAERGEAGVAAVNRAVNERTRFAAAFVDMMMPGIDGAETAKRIWQIDPDIKIVIVTAYSDHTPDDIVHLVGREDLFYLRKPFNPAEIRQFARALTNQWRLEREKALLSAKLEQARKQEIDTAARIQQSLLFGHPPGDMQACEICLKTIPSQNVDGDFFDFIQLNQTTLDVVVGDVMGKGIPAALVGAALKSQLLHALNRLMMAGRDPGLPRPGDIVSFVQADMLSRLEDLETFSTMCYARFDFERHRVEFVDCGHVRTLHFQKKNGACRWLEGINMPLGFPEKEAFTGISTAFEPGDVFVFYSDGITEAKDETAELFGEKRLADVVRQHATETLENLVKRIYEAVVSFSQSETFADDFTCIAVRVAEPELAAPSERCDRRLEIVSDLKELAEVRSFVRNFLSSAATGSLERPRVDLIELAVNEAAVNIIKHAYRNVPDQPILIEAQASDGSIVFRLYDRGRSFDPATVSPPVFDGSQDHGFGVYIISQAVDNFDYSRDDAGRNCTTLRINLTEGSRNAI